MIDQLLSKLDVVQYLADIFHVLHFDELNTPESRARRTTLLVPASLHTLLNNPTIESAPVLEALVIWARPETRHLSKPALESLIGEISGRYQAFTALGYISSLDEDVDDEIRAQLEALLPSNPHEARGAIEKMKEAARTAIGTVLTVSRKYGRPILMRGRALTKFLRDRITQVEFPSRLKEVVTKKETVMGKFDPFKGKKEVKFYVALAVHIGALFATGAAAATLHAGAIALHFIDP